MKKTYIVLAFMLLGGALALCLDAIYVLKSSYPLWLRMLCTSVSIMFAIVALFAILLEVLDNKKEQKLDEGYRKALDKKARFEKIFKDLWKILSQLDSASTYVDELIKELTADKENIYVEYPKEQRFIEISKFFNQVILKLETIKYQRIKLNGIIDPSKCNELRELRALSQILGLSDPLIFSGVEGAGSYNDLFSLVANAIEKIEDCGLDLQAIKSAFENKNSFLNDVGVFSIFFGRHRIGLIIYKNMVIYANSQIGASFSGVVICRIKPEVDVSKVIKAYERELEFGFYDNLSPSAKKFSSMLVDLTGIDLKNVSEQNPNGCHLIRTKAQKVGNCAKSNPVKALQGLLLCMQALKGKREDASDLTIYDVQATAKNFNEIKETYKKITQSLRENAARKFIEVLEKYKKDTDKSLFVKFFLAFLIKLESKPKLKDIQVMLDLNKLVEKIPEVKALYLLHKQASVRQELESNPNDIKNNVGYSTIIGFRGIKEIHDFYNPTPENLSSLMEKLINESGVYVIDIFFDIFSRLIKLDKKHPFLKTILEKLPNEESEDNCYKPFLKEVIKKFDGSDKSKELLSLAIDKYRTNDQIRRMNQSNSLIKLVVLASNDRRSCFEYLFGSNERERLLDFKDEIIIQDLNKIFKERKVLVKKKYDVSGNSKWQEKIHQYSEAIKICECEEKNYYVKISSILDTLYPKSQLEANQGPRFSLK